jgi:hypothetical protein
MSKSFYQVCPFDFYDICNQHELISGCAAGNKAQVFTSPIS